MTREISATIITLNEEEYIERCVRSAAKICREVIVLDSNSTDKTREIASKAGAIVYTQSYLGDGLQKAEAANYASYDWVLSIDADEFADEDMVSFFKEVDLSNEDVAYAFRRKNFLGQEQIMASGFYPDYVTRLYNRKKSGYEKVRRHAKVAAKNIVNTKEHIIHHTYKDLSAWIDRVNSLSTHDALAMYESGDKPKSPGAHALAAFIKKYFFKGGVFQGQDGLTVAMTTAFASYMKYLKLLEFYNKDKPSNKKIN